MSGSRNLAVTAGTASAAIAAAFLTLEQGLLWGICGGVVIGALVGLVVAAVTKRRAQP